MNLNINQKVFIYDSQYNGIYNAVIAAINGNTITLFCKDMPEQKVLLWIDHNDIFASLEEAKEYAEKLFEQQINDIKQTKSKMKIFE